MTETEVLRDQRDKMANELIAVQKQRDALRNMLWGEYKHESACPFRACACEERDAHLFNWENNGPNATNEIICLQELAKAIEADMQWLRETIRRCGTFYTVPQTHLKATCEALDLLRKAQSPPA